MKKVGISQIGIAIPKYFIKLRKLAKKRKISPDYVEKGLGLFESRIPYRTSLEEIAKEALLKIDLNKIERFYVGTESDPDASKPLGIKVLNQKLGLNFIPFQYKLACLAGVQALISACDYVQAYGKPAAVLAFDRSIYSSKDPKAEVTQGSAAVALRVEKNPKILILDCQNLGQYGADIDDFKVPFSSFPFPEVNGELTKPTFLECQKQTLKDWKRKNKKFLAGGNLLEKFDFFITHTPFPKMVEWTAALFWRHEKLKQKEHLTLSQCLKNPQLFKEYKKEIDKVRKTPAFRKFFRQKFGPGLKYNPYIGNAYTCSLFISLIGVLEKAKKGQQIGLHGFGSGAGALGFRGIVSLDKKFKSDLKEQIKKGKELSIREYLKWREQQ